MLCITDRGAQSNTIYFTPELEIRDIIVFAHSTYEISLDNIEFTDDNNISSTALNYAEISKCIINGKSVELKKKDGDVFVKQNTSANSNGNRNYIITIIIGCVFLVVAIFLIAYKIEKALKL